jgi:hypothetical protein
MQHGLGEVVDRLGDIFVGGRGSGHIPAEQAEKTDQHFDVLHGCFLIVVGEVCGQHVTGHVVVQHCNSQKAFGK